MRRPLTADPIFFVMLDAESRLMGCSAPAIVRTATLEFIARNHQTRIPSFFKEERELAIYRDAIKAAYTMFADDEILQELLDISNDSPDRLRLTLYDCAVQYLEREREKVFKRTHPRIKSAINP